MRRIEKILFLKQKKEKGRKGINAYQLAIKTFNHIIIIIFSNFQSYFIIISYFVNECFMEGIISM